MRGFVKNEPKFDKNKKIYLLSVAKSGAVSMAGLLGGHH